MLVEEEEGKEEEEVGGVEMTGGRFLEGRYCKEIFKLKGTRFGSFL